MIKQLIAITAITVCCLGNSYPVNAEGLTLEQKREVEATIQREINNSQQEPIGIEWMNPCPDWKPCIR